VLGHIIFKCHISISAENHIIRPDKQHILSIGEYVKVPFSNESTYATSNKSIITAKEDRTKRKLIIRAKHLGSSLLKIWHPKGVYNHSFTVLSRNSVMKLRADMEELKKLSLEPSIENSKIKLSGVIDTLEKLKALGRIRQKRKEAAIKVSSEVQITSKLKKEITSKIYSKLLSIGHSPIECSFEEIPIKCIYEKSTSSTNALTKYWFNSLPIKFISRNSTFSSKNYRLKVKIVLLEAATANQLTIGLHKANSTVQQLLEKDFASLINDNEVQLNSGDARISSLATPEVVLRANEYSEISIGSEIPFSNKKDDDIYTDWKFAGLKIVSKIEQKGELDLLEISSELSRPNAGEVTTITTNKFKTKIKLRVGQPIKVTDLVHQGVQIENNSTAFVSKIPILGKLFSKTEEIESFKHISIYIKVLSEDEY
jgi:Flp pilus assembly secretin CpaC